MIAIKDTIFIELNIPHCRANPFTSKYSLHILHDGTVIDSVFRAEK